VAGALARGRAGPYGALVDRGGEQVVEHLVWLRDARLRDPLHSGQTGWVRVVVTEIGWEGRMRRRALDTSGLTDAGRWESLIEQVLSSPPPYKAAPGRPVYVIHSGDRAVLVGEQDLTGPLADLVETILETGGRPLAAE
jgi:hypothetical protein